MIEIKQLIEQLQIVQMQMLAHIQQHSELLPCEVRKRLSAINQLQTTIENLREIYTVE